MRKRKWVLILILCIPIVGMTQNLALKFKHIGVEEGLSQATITGITQDKYGFIWIGTQEGLNRYEGYDFKVFKNDPQDNKTISNSYILSLFKDSNENIWIGTQSGLNRYDYKQEKFVKYSFDIDQEKTSHESINVITESVSNPGILWLGTNHGIIEFNTINNTFTENHYHFHDSIEQRQYLVNTIYESPNESGTLWIGTSDGLIKFDPVKKHL